MNAAVIAFGIVTIAWVVALVWFTIRAVRSSIHAKQAADAVPADGSWSRITALRASSAAHSQSATAWSIVSLVALGGVVIAQAAKLVLG